LAGIKLNLSLNLGLGLSLKRPALLVLAALLMAGCASTPEADGEFLYRQKW
jgi:type IV pilus biogenesis protein CpaD/CtpE